MKLYFSPGACSLSPHIVLLEAGLPHTTEKVDLRSKTTAAGIDFRSINPKGYVPALELDGGELLTEGPAITEYLADLAPEKNLAPAAGTMPRYHMISWLNFISTEVHKNYSPLFSPDASEDLKAGARSRLADRYGYLNTVLAGRDYLLDSGYSLADIYLFVVSNWAGMVKVDLTPFPHVMALVQRVSVRPAVQEALRAEGLIK